MVLGLPLFGQEPPSEKYASQHSDPPNAKVYSAILLNLVPAILESTQYTAYGDLREYVYMCEMVIALVSISLDDLIHSRNFWGVGPPSVLNEHSPHIDCSTL